MNIYLIVAIIYIIIGLIIGWAIIEIVSNDEANEQAEEDDPEYAKKRQQFLRQMWLQGDHIIPKMYAIMAIAWLPILIYIFCFSEKD